MSLIGSLKTRIGEVFDRLVREQEAQLCREGFTFLEGKLPDQIGPLRPDFEVWVTALAAGQRAPEDNRWQKLIGRFPRTRDILTNPGLLEIFKDVLAHFVQEQEPRAADVPVVPPPIPVVPPPLPVMGDEVKTEK